ncbi:hypothetical protein LPJ66_011001, partial [Kickxella alabastrina]
QRTLFLVPNRELALQIEHWAHTLLSPFPALSHKKLIQSFVSGTPYEQDQIGILRRHGIPRITLGTPRRLLELLNQPSREHTGLLFGGLARVVVDEIDAVLKLPGKHASEKQIKLRREKPRPGQMLVEKIVGVAPNEQKDADDARAGAGAGAEAGKEAGEQGAQQTRVRKQNARGWQKKSDLHLLSPARPAAASANANFGLGARDRVAESPPAVQLIMASATANKELRSFLRMRNWTSPAHPLHTIDIQQGITLPPSTTHHCLVIENQDSIRNLHRTNPNASASAGSAAGPDSFRRQQRRSHDAEDENPWESDVSRRSAQAQTHVMDLMAEVAANVIRAVQPSGPTLIFVRSDANSAQFAEILHTFGVPAQQPEDMVTHHRQQQQAQKKAPAADDAAREEAEPRPVYLATEEAARGLDIPGTALVLILDIPKSSASYAHLAGRTGRFGRPGTVVSVVPVGRLGWYESKMRGIFHSLSITPAKADFVE